MTMNETDFERDARYHSTDPYAATDRENEMSVASTSRYNGIARHNSNAAYFEGRDIAASVLSAAMMLGPLTAYAVGFGG